MHNEKQYPLKGVKIADFSWVLMGPLATKYLADLGATVVKVESTSSIDSARRMPPYKDNIQGIDRGGAFVMANSSKYDATLDLKNPRGVEIAKRLVAWADVVTDNFSPGIMDQFGLSYEELKKVNPEVIMVGMHETRKHWLDEWNKWSAMKAVKNGHVFSVDADLIVRHTPRILKGARAICEYMSELQ